MMSEAHETVAAIFTDAGWQPSTKDGWKGSFTWSDGVVVGGIDPCGTMRATSNAGFGMTPEEAAAWLVEHARERAPVVLTTDATLDPLAPSPEEQQSPRTYDEATDEYFAQYPEERGHEGDGETGAEAEAGTADQADFGFGDQYLIGADGEHADAGVHTAATDDLLAADDALSGDVSWPDQSGQDGEASSLDADFTEDPLLEFGGEVLEEHPEQQGSGAFIFGDNLEQQRTAAIGGVVRISMAKQAPFHALMGEHDFATIQSAVVRDTIDGIHRGPQDRYNLFVELSRHQSAINRITKAESDKVKFLDKATRADLEAFNPEADWPE